MVDKITSLAGYDDFVNSLQEEMNKMDDGIIAIVYEDIKYFKYFNDTYGYKRGDELLGRMATLVMKKSKKDFGYVSRSESCKGIRSFRRGAGNKPSYDCCQREI